MPITLRQIERSNIPSSVEPTILIVRPEGLATVWAEAALFIQRMLNRGEGEWNLVDAVEFFRTGRWQLWVGVRDEKIEAVLIGEGVKYPQYSVYLIVGFACNDMKFWLPHLETIEKWASDQGFRAITEKGRKGWFRKLRGWRLAAVEMRKELR